MTDSEMQLSDDEDYDLEYDSNSESEPDVDLENQYYHAKSVKVSQKKYRGHYNLSSVRSDNRL